MGLDYWVTLLVAPLLVAAFGMVFEFLFLRRLYGLDPIYGLLLTFSLVLVLEGGFRVAFGSSGQPFATPEQLRGTINLEAGHESVAVENGHVSTPCQCCC